MLFTTMLYSHDFWSPITAVLHLSFLHLGNIIPDTYWHDCLGFIHWELPILPARYVPLTASSYHGILTAWTHLLSPGTGTWPKKGQQDSQSWELTANSGNSTNSGKVRELLLLRFPGCSGSHLPESWLLIMSLDFVWPLRRFLIDFLYE